MSISMPGESQGTSTRPYLLRALHEWCTDNGFTPYLAVYVDATVQVPMEYVKNNEIVLNVGFEATSALSLGNEFVEFKARFGGTSRSIQVPVDHVVAIYARENGQGMAFPVPTDTGTGATAANPGGVAPAARGLRMVGPVVPDSTPLALAASSPPTSVPVEPPTDELPPPKPGAASGARPSLKRIK